MSISKKNLLITLKHMSRVMAEVAEAELSLDMSQWYQESQLNFGYNATIHNCGTAACVAGYCALDKKIMEHLNLSNDLYTYNENAEFIFDILEEYDFAMCCSILSENHFLRVDYAYDFLEDYNIDRSVANKFSHLTSNAPTATDAKEWIDYVITIMEK